MIALSDRTNSWILLAVLFFSSSFGQGTTPCPAYNQSEVDGKPIKGMDNNANINIQLSTFGGEFASGAVGAAEDGIDGWAALPGSNQDYSVSSGAVDADYEIGRGTAAAPQVVVEVGTPAQIAAMSSDCAGREGCSATYVQSDGDVIGQKVLVTAAVAADPLELAKVISHEVGVHGDMGWADCSPEASEGCQNSDSGQGMYTGVGPKAPCDTNQAKACGR